MPATVLGPDAIPLGRTLESARQPIGFAPGGDRQRGPSGGRLLCSRGEDHMLVVGRTGAGKGRSLVIPALLSNYRGTVICLDVKGEAAAVTARHRARIGPVYAVDPWKRLPALGVQVPQASLNPLQALVMRPRDDNFADDCLSIAHLLGSEQLGRTVEAFWPLQGVRTVAGFIGYVANRLDFDPAAGAEVSLTAVHRLLHGDDPRYAMAVVVDTHGKKPEFDPFVRDSLVGYLQLESTRVAPSVLSEAQLMCRLFASPLIHEATRHTTIDLEAVRRGDPLTIYLVIPPERLQSHAMLCRLWLNTLLTVATRRTVMPAVPSLFLVDEAAQLGEMPQLRDCVTLLRGYGVRVALFLQSLTQLHGMFGQQWETVAQNCGTLLSFGHATLTGASHVAALLGDVSADALFDAPADAIAIHEAGSRTYMARRLDYLSDPLFVGRFDANPYHAARVKGRG